MYLFDCDNATISNRVIDSDLVQGGTGGIATQLIVGSYTTDASGGDGLSFNVPSIMNFALGTQSLALQGGVFCGGNGGEATGQYGNYLLANGGYGLWAQDAVVSLENILTQGGRGGTNTTSSGQANYSYANGGIGFNMDFDSTILSLDNAMCYGGNGGLASLATHARAHAGDGARLDIGLFSLLGTDTNLILDGGIFAGGDGGIANISSPASHNLFDRFRGLMGGSRGGHGLWIANFFGLQSLHHTTVNGGLFQGGNGGIATNNLSGDITADGGHGLLIIAAKSTINDGEFIGGEPGMANGAVANHGSALYALDSDISIVDGNFTTGGIQIASIYNDGLATISGGMIGDATFTSHYDDYLNTYERTNEVHVLAGTFSNTLFNGECVNKAIISGGSFATIEFGGLGTNLLNISGSPTIGVINQTSGTVICPGSIFVETSYNLSDGRLVVLDEIPSSTNTLNFTEGSTGYVTMPTNNYDFATLIDAGTITYNSAVVPSASGLWIIDHSVSNKTTLSIGISIVKNIMFEQQPGTKLVDVSYDLESTITNTMSICAELYTNGVFATSLSDVSGQIGSNVTTGINRQFTWNAGIGWSADLAAVPTIKIVVDDGFAGASATSGAGDIDTRDYFLTVISGHGNPIPGTGTTTYAWQSSVTCAVENTITESGTLYSNLGWNASGVSSASGTTNSTILFLSSPTSILEWNWLNTFDVDDDGLPNDWELEYFYSTTAAEPDVDNDDDGYTN